MKSRRIQWNQLRTEYITGVNNKGRKHSLKSIAAQFGVSVPAVEKKSREEGWVQLRDNFLSNIERQIQKRKEDTLIAQAFEFDEQIFQTARAILAILNSRLIVIHPDGSSEPNRKLPILEIQRIANILQMIQPVREKAIGDAGGADESSLTELNKILEDAQGEEDLYND